MSKVEKVSVVVAKKVLAEKVPRKESVDQDGKRSIVGIIADSNQMMAFAERKLAEAKQKELQGNGNSNFNVEKEGAISLNSR